jgi:putative NIF3 family GTP cyclohydrolase 1 type 2
MWKAAWFAAPAVTRAAPEEETMTTDELMQIALDMVGMKEVPADSAVHVPGNHIQRVLFALDVSSAELLYAREQSYDCVLSHHPRGRATAHFYRILDRQTTLLEELGVPLEEAEKATARMRRNAFLAAHRANWEDPLRLAERLRLPFLNVHTPLDELGRQRMVAKLAERVFPQWLVRDVLAALMEFPEMAKSPLAPVCALGREESRAGKVAVFHGAGTNGGFGAADALYRFGYDTVVYIHLDGGELERIQATHPDRNLIVSGHLASDMVGINPYLEELRHRGLQVDSLSTF